MVKVILMDMEFEKIIDVIDTAIINTTGAREHIIDTERNLDDQETGRCIVSVVNNPLYKGVAAILCHCPKR